LNNAYYFHYRFESAEHPEVWTGKVLLPKEKDILFRYFVCMRLENSCGTHDQATVMRRWETAIQPRKIKRIRNGEVNNGEDFID
jgi:hypothetical protein